MRRFGFSAIALTLIFGPTDALAQDYRVNSSTYLRAYSQPGAPDETRHFPFYEFISLQTRDMGLEGLSVDASLWGKVDAGQITGSDRWIQDERIAGDVNVLNVRYVAPHESALEGLDVRAGRQFVAVGTSMYEQLDGGFATYRLPFGLNLSAFGGAVSGIRFTRQPWANNLDDIEFGGNWTAGGRVGFNHADSIQLGVGYRQKRYAGRMAFNEVNWDVVAMPLSKLEVLLDGVAELTSGRLKELRAGLRYQLLDDLDAGVNYRYTAPDLFVARSSIFAVFSNELFQDFYAELWWTPTRWLELYGEGGAFIYGDNCSSDDPSTPNCDTGAFLPKGLLRADIRFGLMGVHKATIEMERNGASDGGFWRWRGATRIRLFEKMSVIFDLDGFLLDGRDIDGQYVIAEGRSRFGFTGGGYVAYDVRENVNVMFGGNGTVSPIYNEAGSLMIRLNWMIDGLAIEPSRGPVAMTRSNGYAMATGNAMVGGAL